MTHQCITQFGRICFFFHHVTFIVISCIFISGCASGTLNIITPVENKLSITSVDITETNQTFPVSQEIRSYFNNKLKSCFFENGNFKKGSDIKIEYTIIEYQPGNPFLGWLLSPITFVAEFKAVSGIFSVYVRYVNPTGEILSSIQVEGKIIGGFLGGSFENAIDKVAYKIVEHTTKEFK